VRSLTSSNRPSIFFYIFLDIFQNGAPTVCGKFQNHRPVNIGINTGDIVSPNIAKHANDNDGLARRGRLP
jgi:hypothetical protein